MNFNKQEVTEALSIMRAGKTTDYFPGESRPFTKLCQDWLELEGQAEWNTDMSTTPKDGTVVLLHVPSFTGWRCLVLAEWVVDEDYTGWVGVHGESHFTPTAWRLVRMPA